VQPVWSPPPKPFRSKKAGDLGLPVSHFFTVMYCRQWQFVLTAGLRGCSCTGCSSGGSLLLLLLLLWFLASAACRRWAAQTIWLGGGASTPSPFSSKGRELRLPGADYYVLLSCCGMTSAKRTILTAVMLGSPTSAACHRPSQPVRPAGGASTPSPFSSKGREVRLPGADYYVLLSCSGLLLLPHVAGGRRNPFGRQAVRPPPKPFRSKEAGELGLPVGKDRNDPMVFTINTHR
jgi:hypothetical protein